MVIGLFPFVFIVSHFLVAFLGYNLNIQMPAMFAVVASAIAVWVLFMTIKHFKANSFLVYPLILLGFIASISISLYFYDGSYDGQWYQQRAVYRIAMGWNPYTEAAKEAVMYDNTHLILNHYARGAWIVEANIYALTGRIEASKMFHFFCIWGLIFLSYFSLTFVPKFAHWQRIIIALLLAFNPVSVNQMLSFYQDGIVSSLYIALALLLFIYINDATLRKWMHLYMIGIIFLVVNIKLIALAFCGVIVIIMGLFWLLFERQKKIFQDSLTLLFAIMIGVAVLGYTPYVKNQLVHGHILYPLNQPVYKQIWLDNITPIPFRQNNRFQNIWYSMFIDPDHEYSDVFEQRRLPFGTGYNPRKLIFTCSAPKVLGWGFWFGEATILSCILLPCIWYENRKIAIITIGLEILLLCTIFCLYYTYQARYVPQAFLWCIIPLFAIGYLERKWIHVLSTGLVAILIGNIGLLGYFYVFENYLYTVELRNNLHNLSTQHATIILPENEYFSLSEKIKYEENHIPTKWVSDKSKLPCNSPFLMSSNTCSPRCIEEEKPKN